MSAVTPEIIEAYQAGSERAFEVIYCEYLGLVRYLLLKIKPIEVREELIQDVFMRVFRYRTQFDPARASLKTWVGEIAKNARLDWAKSMSRKTKREILEREEERYGRLTAMNTTPAELVERLDLVEKRIAALSCMVPRQLQILWASDVEGLTYEELQARFDLKPAASKSLLQRARAHRPSEAELQRLG